MASATAASGSGTENAGKSHPKGLYILFGTEMWERFSYYGMRALLVLYMINQFGWQPSDASTVYKWYTSLVYLFPLLGGYLADRYLGLRLSIIIGGVLMAIGHFLMAFEALPIFYTALGFLVVGNGFFKPNISTMVGRMYTQNDARRDGAFTIFYMGINLGAFLAPLVCGEWLRKTYGFHYGFAAAGVGMMAGLLMFITGQKQVLADVAAAGNDVAVSHKKGDPEATQADKSEEADEKEPAETGFPGLVAKFWPIFLLAIGAVVPIRAIYLTIAGEMNIKDTVMMCAFAAIAGWMAITLFSIKGKARDKSTVIFVLFMFTVLFWMAFEQAGNALNIWAEYNTDKHIGSFEYSAETFQSLNPLLIFILAPVFSAMWLMLARKNMNPSTPIKFLIAMVFMVLSFGAMVGGAIAENAQVSNAPLATLPAGVKVEKINAGRTKYEAGKLEISGVFPTFAVIEAYEMAVDPKIVDVSKKLEEQSKEASAEKPLQVVLDGAPATFAVDLTNADADVKKAIGAYDPATKTLTITGSLGAEGKRAFLGAAAPPEFRAAIETIARTNESGRVSGFWLFLSYLLATIGELCLSPVGLSMVTKLAPRRFASLFMGVWLLASSVAQYLGGSLGEMWGQIPPTDYFWIFVATSVGGSLVLVVLASPVRKLMHGVS